MPPAAFTFYGARSLSPHERFRLLRSSIRSDSTTSLRAGVNDFPAREIESPLSYSLRMARIQPEESISLLETNSAPVLHATCVAAVTDRKHRGRQRDNECNGRNRLLQLASFPLFKCNNSCAQVAHLSAVFFYVRLYDAKLAGCDGFPIRGASCHFTPSNGRRDERSSKGCGKDKCVQLGEPTISRKREQQLRRRNRKTRRSVSIEVIHACTASMDRGMK